MPEKEKNCLNDNFDSPYGIRTRVTAVKRRCLNPLTNGPEVLEKFSLTLLLLYQIDFICLHFFQKNVIFFRNLFYSYFIRKNNQT